MAKTNQITAVGFVTLTGVATPKGRKSKTVHTARIGFAGYVVKSELNKAAKDLKGVLEKQLRREYPEALWDLKLSSRVTINECDMLMNGNTNETAGN